MMTTQSSPVITDMKVIPVAGHDSMLLNIGGAHNAYFTRNIVVLTDNAGNTGVGEAPGGEVIYQTLVDAIPQVLGQEVARLMEEGIDFQVDDTEDTGVVGVGGHAFQSEQDQVFQTNQVGAAGGQVFAQHQLLALGDQTVQIGSRLPDGRTGQFFRSCAGFQRRPVIQGLGSVADRDAFADDTLQTGRIEVDIGDGGEQGFDDEFVDGCVLGAEHDGAVGVHRHPFGQIQ